MARLQADTDRFDEVRAAVAAGLTRYNDQFLPKERDRFPFALSVRDEDDMVVGGLIGERRMDWLYVDLLWVDETQRGKGFGKQLLAEAERAARAFGLTHVHLWTWQFQAPEFYRAQGYVECGRLDNHPAGIASYNFVKAI